MFALGARCGEELGNDIGQHEQQGVHIARVGYPTLDQEMVVVGQKMAPSAIFDYELRDKIRAIEMFGRYEAQSSVPFAKII